MTVARGRHAFVLGGARSGKSVFAEGLAGRHARRTYLATAEPIDDEMRRRIEEHRERRGEGWRTFEAPLDLASPLREAEDDVVLVDCLTVWLGNLLHHGRDVAGEMNRLLEALSETPAGVVLVSNEVGLGLVPETRLGRTFRDAQGRLNQRIAAVCGDVFFVAAGLPLVLKGKLP